MNILYFMIKYWDSILVILVVIGIIIYLIKTGQTKILKQIALKLVTEAEGEMGSGTGELKKSAVIEWLYEKLPAILKLIFTKEDLGNIVESVLEKAKETWKENPDIKGYIETKQDTGKLIIAESTFIQTDIKKEE